VASAYGWVTIEILSMVKQEHPLYSNISNVGQLESRSQTKRQVLWMFKENRVVIHTIINLNFPSKNAKL
jgi:hypothetical protein